MAAAVAHELTQTFLDKPWANAYPLSFLPAAGNAVQPTSSVRGGDEPVELDIELPVDEWGEWGAGSELGAHRDEGKASAKRQLDADASSSQSAKRFKDDEGARSMDPPVVFHKRRSHSGGRKHQRRTSLRSPNPSPPPAARPLPPQRARSIPREEASTSEGARRHNFVFDFTSEPPKNGGRNGKNRPKPAQLPPADEAPFLTEQMLVPDLHGISFADYMPYLIDTPVEPKWSGPLFQLLLEFFHECEPREVWASRPERLMRGASLHWVSKQVTMRQPDRRAIQATFSPGRSPGWESLNDDRRVKFLAMLDVMKWLFEDETLTVDAVSHLVRHAPLPLHILVREYASVVRLSEATQHAERELIQHLNSLRRVSPHQAAAIVLLRWFQSLRSPNRHYVFFTHPDGSLRFNLSEPPWAWWFKRVEVGDPCTAEVLDEWEKGVLAEEDWSDF
ncbi:hypothetical protein NBRC10512_000094 [Rhodotorula toruloides]|uniref:RHTO0S09e05930g1_1 n=2 Tax=Rhodotorula toruloides TaxID=5286 RepID=A0A061B451_RHOTO|nr:uncharacterized protein RHTO_03991 [Rhodotorula toruloides NP11]EMS19947.1 hypothetical protein RHTO_03991 [Rhodotorula toruloides NP11]CDR44542.1 RHTO0S09e05930g1_1 [Rhodotorula toruloides]